MPGRLSSALAGIGVVGLAYFLGRRFFAQPILFVSGLAISTNVAFYESGRAAQTDMPLQFFVLVAAVLAVGIPGGALCSSALVMGAYAAAGLAVLTTGPVGLVPPGFILLGVLIARKDWMGLPVSKT